uniref:Uncharacterized protein n=1 Tax=Setaria italica TaxID=4555 RepID=K4AP86_SETIT
MSARGSGRMQLPVPEEKGTMSSVAAFRDGSRHGATCFDVALSFTASPAPTVTATLPFSGCGHPSSAAAAA